MKWPAPATLALLVGLCWLAQQPSASIRFSVVSIKPDPPNYRVQYAPPGSPGPVYPGGMFWNQHSLLFGLIGFAYPAYANPGKTLIGLPAWAYNKSGLYDIEAKPAPGTHPTLEQVRVMMRSLLRERFGLKFHEGHRVMPVYFLEIAKGGVRNIRPSVPGEPHVYPRLRPWQDYSGALAHAVTMNELASYLSFEFGRPVIDRTGMGGVYDIDVKPGPKPGTPGENRLQRGIAGLRQKLGLKLASGKASVPVMIVDSAVRPTAN